MHTKKMYFEQSADLPDGHAAMCPYRTMFSTLVVEVVKVETALVMCNGLGLAHAEDKTLAMAVFTRSWPSESQRGVPVDRIDRYQLSSHYEFALQNG